jgi:hypothetical protein
MEATRPGVPGLYWPARIEGLSLRLKRHGARTRSIRSVTECRVRVAELAER